MALWAVEWCRVGDQHRSRDISPGEQRLADRVSGVATNSQRTVDGSLGSLVWVVPRRIAGHARGSTSMSDIASGGPRDQCQQLQLVGLVVTLQHHDRGVTDP